MMHQFIIIEVVEFRKLEIHGPTTSWILCNGLNFLNDDITTIALGQFPH
jgi:hypothetical protein